MRRLKVTLPAGLAVAALCGLAGCGGSSTGTTDAGAAIPGSTATSANGATSPAATVSGPSTTAAPLPSPTVPGINDPIHGWKGSATEVGAEGSCAWLTTEQFKTGLGDLATNISGGFYSREDHPADDESNPGGTSWACYVNLGPERSRAFVQRIVSRDLTHAKSIVRAGTSPVSLQGLGDEAYDLLSEEETGIWRILAVRTGTTEVDVALRVGSDPQDVFAIPDRIGPLVALYRMLPTP